MKIEDVKKVKREITLRRGLSHEDLQTQIDTAIHDTDKAIKDLKLIKTSLHQGRGMMYLNLSRAETLLRNATSIVRGTWEWKS